MANAEAAMRFAHPKFFQSQSSAGTSIASWSRSKGDNRAGRV